MLLSSVTGEGGGGDDVLKRRPLLPLPACPTLCIVRNSAVIHQRKFRTKETRFPFSQTIRGRRGSSVLAGPALDLPLRAVFIIWASSPTTGQSCNPVPHVQQHHLQWVCIHSSLVSLGSTFHVYYHAPIKVFTLQDKKADNSARQY